MLVQFDATLDDFVDVTTRGLSRSKQIRKWRWDGLLTTGLMAWLAIYALFPGPSANKMLVGFIAAVVAHSSSLSTNGHVRFCLSCSMAAHKVENIVLQGP